MACRFRVSEKDIENTNDSVYCSIWSNSSVSGMVSEISHALLTNVSKYIGRMSVNTLR
jgi:hypothetical protein